MSEAIALPGIDAAPAASAPAAPPAASQLAENTATPSARVDTPVTSGNDAPIDNARDPESDAQGSEDDREHTGESEQPRNEGERRRRPRDGGMQRRFDEMATRNAQLTDLLTRVIGGRVDGQQQPGNNGQQPAADADPEPQEGQFSSWNDYMKAVGRWEGRQEARKVIAERDAAAQRQYNENTQRAQVEQAQRGVEQMQTHLGTSMHEAAARYPDYVDVIEGSSFDHPVALQAVVASSDAPGDVAYYLAKHEDVARQLARLSPIKAAHYVARIAHAMKNSSSVSANAPTPGRPQGTRGSSPMAYPEHATVEQHLAWEAQQQQRAGAKR
jgi:hypothetical protein